MPQTDTLTTVASKQNSAYPQFLLEKYLSSEDDQKKVKKALRKTFLMRAYEEQIVTAQAEDLAKNTAQEKLPFADEFALYLNR